MKLKPFLVCLFVFAVAQFARAHTPGLSTIEIRHHGEQLDATLIFSTAEIENILPLGANSDGATSPEKLASAKPKLEKLARTLLLVSVDEKQLSVSETKCVQDENDNLRFDLKFEPARGEHLKVVSKWINALPPGHRQFVKFQEGTNAPRTEDLLDGDSNIFTTQLVAAEIQNASKSISFTRFFLLGVEHILTGYDHLLFLFGLLIVCTNFKSIAKIITCFTLAHSVTLALATLNIAQIPSRVIEPTIAASIVYVGLENIFRRGEPKGRWLLTFAFGLVHGFGFASVLREMEIAKAGSVLVPLVSFNLGVEVGQIAVAAMILPLFWYFRKKPEFTLRWIPACSILVAAAGAFWFVERVWF